MTAKAVALSDIVAYLDGYLRIHEVPDDPNALNGLQVENAGSVERIVAAVDASLATIEAVGAGSLLLVHHGLFWDGNLPVTGRRRRRLKSLLDQNVALYSAHMPLDIHPTVGNNAVLAGRLGLTDTTWFGSYRGVEIGVSGTCPSPVSREQLRSEVERVLQIPAGGARLIPGGSTLSRRVGVITGAGGSMIAAARDAGCDTFITGEGPAHTYFDAMEWGVNVIYAGHYATETAGVQALADQLSLRFGLPWEFDDHPTGM